MKIQTALLVVLVTLTNITGYSQTPPEPPRQIPTRALATPAGLPRVPSPDPVLTKFSLDFPGGTPKQLVGAIEKAMGKPLNAIIPAEHADIELPPLKMSNVDVWQLFQALELTSQKTEAYVTGAYNPSNPMAGRFPGSYQQMRTGYGFRTTGERSDDSIWYFYVEKPNLPPLASPIPKICRFYSLTPYLERGVSVEDITTAIQTGWKMLGDKEIPAISFHKETKLLIAVGEPAKLETIDAVLQALQPPPENYTARMNSIIQKANANPLASPAPSVPPTPLAIPKPPKPSTPPKPTP